MAQYIPDSWLDIKAIALQRFRYSGVPAWQVLHQGLCGASVQTTVDMQVGVAALHQMSVVLASTGGAELDTSGWQGLTDMLHGACGMDTVAAVPLQQRQETVVMVQRSVSQILSHCGRCMPPCFHLQLLQIVQESVLRAAAANREVAAAVIVDQLDTSTPGDSGPQPEVSEPPSDLPAGAQLDAQGAAESGKGSVKDGVSSPLADAQVQIEPAVSPHNGAENGVGNQPGCVEHGDERSDTLSGGAAVHGGGAITWLDQQNEGGKLLIKSYLLTIDLFKQSAARSPTLVEAAECAAEAEQRFTALCNEIIAAVRSSHSIAGSTEPEKPVDWSTRYNAPVLCALLRAVRKRGGDESWAKVVMPHLPLLIRSGDPSVCTAVAAVYEHVVGPKLMAGSS